MKYHILAKNTDDGPKKTVYTAPDGAQHIVVATDGDAACCCESKCWVKVIPCFCDREEEARFITGEQAAIFWSSQNNGMAAIEINGVCYRGIGERLYSGVDASLVLDATNSIIHPNCYSGPCADQAPCPPCTGGFGYEVLPEDQCVDHPASRCVARSVVTSYGIGRYKRTDSLGVRTTVVLSWSQTQVWEAVGTQASLISSSAAAFYKETNADGSSKYANVVYDDVEVVGQGASGRGVFFEPNAIQTSAFIRSPDLTVTSTGGTVTNTGGTVGVGMYPNGLGCDLGEYAGPDGASGQIVESSGLSMYEAYGSSGFTAFKNTRHGETTRTTTIRESNTRQFQYAGEAVDAVPAEHEVCRDPRIAQACNPDASPQQISYDLKTKPAWAKSIIHQENDELYVLTAEVSSEDGYRPILYSDQTCDEETSVFVAEQCGDPNTTVAYDDQRRTADGVTFIYNDERYLPTNIPSASEPITGEVWTPDECENEQPCVARLCLFPSSQTNITYDRSIMPSGARTCVYGGRRYFLLSTVSQGEIVDVAFSFNDCVGVDCDDLGANDPRCALPEYQNCPQCLGGPIDPDPDKPQFISGGLGDATKQAINRAARIITGGRIREIKQCKGCRRRQNWLNRKFGRKKR